MESGLFDDLLPQQADPFADIGTEPGFTPGDYLKGLKRGIQQIPGSLPGLADVPGALLTGERYADQSADKLGDLTGFKPGQWAKETKLSPGGEAAMQELDTAWKKSGADRLGSALLGNWDDLPQAWRQADLSAAGKAIAENPGAAAMNVVESIPGMLVGGGIGKGLAVAGKVAPVVAGAAGEGIITAGQQMDQTDRDADPRTAAATALAAGAGTGLIAGVGGKIAQRLGLEDVQTAMAGGRADDVGRGMAGRVGGGAAAEAGQEFLQSGQEQAWQNVAEGKPLGDDVIRSSVEGAIAGAVMGGGSNLLPPQPVTVPRQDGQGDAVIDPATGPISAAAVDHVQRTQTSDDLFGDLMPAAPVDSAIEPLVNVPETGDPFADLVPASPLQDFAAQVDPVSLDEAQALAAQADGAQVVAPHPAGDGYLLAPREWFQPEQIDLALQPGKQKATDPLAGRIQAVLDAYDTAGHPDNGRIILAAMKSRAPTEQTVAFWEAQLDRNLRTWQSIAGQGQPVEAKLRTADDLWQGDREQTTRTFVPDDITAAVLARSNTLVQQLAERGVHLDEVDSRFPADVSGIKKEESGLRGLFLRYAKQLEARAKGYKRFDAEALAKTEAELFQAIGYQPPAIAPRGWENFQAGDRVTTKSGTTGTLSFDETGTIARVTPDVLDDGSQASPGNTSAFDQYLFTIAEAPWGDVRAILSSIAQGSASAFNRELAKLLMAQNLATTIQTAAFDGQHSGGYNPQTDVITIMQAADVEQTSIHELMHAATVRALSNKSVAAGAMRALLKEVRQHLGLDSHYGLTDVREFVAEAFSNPEFQEALRQIPVKASGIRGKIADAWGRFVSTVRQLLGLDRDQETALGKALELGARLMQENQTAPLRGYMGEIIGNQAKTDDDRLTVRDWLNHQMANQRSWALGALTRDQLADIYGREMPEVAEFDRVVQQMDQARNIVAEQADALIERWRKLPSKMADALADVMHLATLEQFDPDTKTREEVQTPEQSILVKEWGNLSPEAQQIYRDVRDQYQATLVKLRNGLAKRADTQTAAAIRLEFDKYLAEGPYFPLARFGDFILIANNRIGERIVEAFESSAAREKRARGLRAQGWTTKLTAKKAYSAASDGPSGEFVGKVLGLVGGLDIEAKEKAALMDSLNQLAIGALPDQSYRKHFSHRKGTPGFSQDAMRAFASSMQHVAHHVARVLHGDELQILVDGLNKRTRETIGDVDTTTMQQVANELSKRLDLMLNPTTHPVTAALGQVGFVMSLGGSVASGITNLSQTPLVTFPWLGSRFGFGKAAAALTRASKDYFGSKWDRWSGFVMKDSASLSADERRALTELEDAGLINLTQAHDLAGTANTDSASSRRSFAINRAMKLVGWTFHVPEVMNRQVSALAAYRLAREKGQDHTAAIETARETLRRTHFDYSASNRARWMAGNFTRVITMFKQYSQNVTYLLWRQTHQALKGESPEVRQEARRMLLGVAATHFAAAGALGLPLGVFGVSPLLGLLAMGMGSEDEPWDWQVEFRNLLADLFGKQAGEAIAYGPLRTLTGIDMAARVGLGDLWVRAPQAEKEGRDLVEAWMLTLLGPVAGYAGNIGTAMKAFDEGKVGRGLEAMLPKFIAAPIKASRYEREGVKSWRGDDLGVKLDGGDIFATALGFQPSQLAEMFEGQRAIKGREAKLMARREEIANMFTSAALAGDQEMQAEAIKAAQAFSLRNPSMALTADSLHRSLQAKVRNQAMIQDGVYLSKKRQDLRAEGRFANLG